MPPTRTVSLSGSIDLLAPHVRMGAYSGDEYSAAAFTLYNYRGSIVMASAWLAAYAAAAILG